MPSLAWICGALSLSRLFLGANIERTWHDWKIGSLLISKASYLQQGEAILSQRVPVWKPACSELLFFGSLAEVVQE